MTQGYIPLTVTQVSPGGHGGICLNLSLPVSIYVLISVQP